MCHDTQTSVCVMTQAMATTKPLGIGCYRDFPVDGTAYTVCVTRTADVAYTVFVVTTDAHSISTRVAGHTRTFSAVEHGAGYRDAADAYRQQLADELAPAADVISAATTLLELAAAVDGLTQPQQRAIRTADGAGHIDRRNVGTVKTLYALAAANLGVLTHHGYRITGLDLNTRGLAMRDHLHTYTAAIAA